MRCISPLKASHNRTGDLTYRSRQAMKGLIGIQFECRKCLPCRLNIAREKAVRAVHEAKMHQSNIFLTLTYSDAALTSPRLNYSHFQLFMKSLRERITRDVTNTETIDRLYVPYMVTGEYGDKTKRPHWHAILFNYAPEDSKYHYSSDRGDKVYTSKLLQDLWGNGNIEFGSVTMDSAGYVARYSAKKLVHGKDQDHDYHPIHKTSSRRAIGRSWIEKYFEHPFNHGYVILPDGTHSKIPRYYVDWAKQYKPNLWEHYVTKILPKIIESSQEKIKREEIEYISEQMNYRGGRGYPLTRSKVEETILKQKFKRLQELLKL